jgi:hypothetical protein
MIMSLRRPCPFAHRLGIVASSSFVCVAGEQKSYLLNPDRGGAKLFAGSMGQMP